MVASGTGHTVQSRRSLGTQPSTTADLGGGVVQKTQARNQSANNPGGTGGSGRTNPNSPLSSSGGPAVISTKGRTIAGTNKTIG